MTARRSTSGRGGHAIVIGASMAGLLTARVLSAHFERVTLLERDPVSDAPQSRKGQPQTRHLHFLLAQGLQVLTRYFPDLPEALEAGGASLADMAEEMRWYCHGGYRVRHHSGLRLVLMTRPFLECHVRGRVQALPNVTLQDRCAAAGLTMSGDGARVVGLRLLRDGEAGREDTLGADLIVDATGRGSPSPPWLQAVGYPRPQEDTVTVRVGYATRFYRRDPLAAGDGQWRFVTPQIPGERRGGGAFPVEGGRWLVTVAGWHGDHPPADEAGFMAFARGLPAPDIYDLISRCEPLSDIVLHKFPSSLRRRYEKLSRFPDGYLVIGDALASFNPIYGQGMTSAALQAQELDKVLSERRSPRGIARTFFRRAAKLIDIPWRLAVGEDFRFPETAGHKAVGTDLVNAYVDLVHRATHSDPVVCTSFLEVLNLLRPPTSLFHPGTALRVLRAGRNHRSATHQQAVRTEQVARRGGSG